MDEDESKSMQTPYTFTIQEIQILYQKSMIVKLYLNSVQKIFSYYFSKKVSLSKRLYPPSVEPYFNKN